MSAKGLQKQKVKMAMAWQGKNKHYLWERIQLRHIFHTAKLAGLSQESVEILLHEIIMQSKALADIRLEALPHDVVEPIMHGFETQLNKIKQYQ